jgi:hypothetical protein
MKSTTYTLTAERQVVYGPKVGSNWIYIRATGNDCYIGGANVTDTNGLNIKNGDTLSIFVERGQSLYGVGKTESHVITVLEPSSA